MIIFGNMHLLLNCKIDKLLINLLFLCQQEKLIFFTVKKYGFFLFIKNCEKDYFRGGGGTLSVEKIEYR